MKVAIYGNTWKGCEEYTSILFNQLKKHNAQISMYEPFWEMVKKSNTIVPQVNELFTGYKDFNQATDFLISLGGDGTFLQSIRIVQNTGVPIIGLNTGRLGFLATISPDEIDTAITSIFNKQYTIEERSLLKLAGPESHLSDFPYALNEITFQKKESNMITIHISINDEFLNSYWADGLIISTPTGSTAYSLAVGAPIVYPQTKSLIIAPIAPHNLSIRPLIVPENSNFEIRIESRNNQFLTTLDSRSEVFSSVTSFFKVQPAEFTIKMLKLHSKSFFNTLRNKLMWGADKRN